MRTDTTQFDLLDPLEGFVPLEIECGPTFGRSDEREARRDLLQLETRGTTGRIYQGSLWRSQLDFKASVAAKLRGGGFAHLAEPLEHCHTESLNLRCTGCKKTSKFWNRCDLFYCPTCQPRLARERAESVEFWTKEISQPKHVVLTVRNSMFMNDEYVDWFLDAWRRLFQSTFAKKKTLWWHDTSTDTVTRIRKFRPPTKTGRTRVSEPWQGGFWRLEVTNEDKGWHLHIHCLIDCAFIFERALAVEWEKFNGGLGHIVKVLDAREKDYLAEVTKYAVKGSDIAGWETQDIVDFVLAFKGRRTFGVFGKLYKLRAKHTERMQAVAAERVVCACGCSDFKICTDKELEWMELHVGCPVERTSLPGALPSQLDLAGLAQTHFDLYA